MDDSFPLSRLEKFALAQNPLLRAAGKPEIRFITFEESIAYYEMGDFLKRNEFMPESMRGAWEIWIEENPDRYGCKNPRLNIHLRSPDADERVPEISADHGVVHHVSRDRGPSGSRGR